MRKLLVAFLLLLWFLVTAEVGDATRKVAYDIAGVIIVLSPVLLKFVRKRWPDLDGRVFSGLTFLAATVVVVIALLVTGEWRVVDTSSAWQFFQTAMFAWGIQQAVFNLFKPQLAV